MNYIKLFEEFKDDSNYKLEEGIIAKNYLEKKTLSKKDYDMLVSFDKTKTKKYVDWLAKIWVTEKPNKDILRNSIEEFDVLLNRGKTKTKDIFSFKTLEDLTKELDVINATGGNMSVKELENDYEVILDNKDLFIAIPHTHDASRKLGLSKFEYRKCKEREGEKDSAWCTTYKAPDHFNDYYYKNNITFFYVRVLSNTLKDELKKYFTRSYDAMEVVALVLNGDDGSIDGYDGLDKKLSQADVKKFIKITGIEDLENDIENN